MLRVERAIEMHIGNVNVQFAAKNLNQTLQILIDVIMLIVIIKEIV
nr:MAG TPA: hypothetical protein [Caudoviricetes sp.]